MTHHMGYYLLLVYATCTCTCVHISSMCPPMNYHSSQQLLRYSSSMLREIRSTMSPQKLKLPDNVYNYTLSLGIAKRHRIHRGCRGGEHKQRHLNSSSSSLALLPSNNSLMTTLGLMNCQSACNKADIIKDYIQDHNIDIIALTETWFKPNDDISPAQVTHRGFKLVHASKKARKGGGVALLSKSGLMASVAKQRHDNQTPSHSSFAHVEVDIIVNNQHLRLIVL